MTARLRILMVVSNDVIHDSRVLKEARALVSAGHDVQVIGWDRSGSLDREEEWDGVRIYRVRTEGAMRLLGKDLFRNPAWWRHARHIARRLTFDVVHCHDLDTLPIGVALKRSDGVPLVYDCHEVFGYMIEADVPGVVVDYTFRMERDLAPNADRVITVNEMVKEYIDRVSGKDAVLVRNCHDRILDTYRPPPGPPFTILYLGTLHVSRFILPAIEAMADLPQARLVIGGSKRLTSLVEAACARRANARFLGMVPSVDVVPMTIDSHMVLSMFDPAYRINHVGLPNKIFEAMAAGRPCLVTAHLRMADLVVKEECGLAVEYTKAAFREAVARLIDDPGLADRLGRNGLAAAKREYNWDYEKRKLLALYESIAGAG